MGQIANLVAFDGASTPVSHTFVPEAVSREGKDVVFSYKELNAAVPEYALNRVTMRKAKLSSGVNRVSCRVEIPVMESISGQNAAGYTAAPKVAYVDVVDVVGYFHDRSLQTGRQMVRGLAKNIMWGTTATQTAILSGPLPELMDQLNPQT